MFTGRAMDAPQPPAGAAVGGGARFGALGGVSTGDAGGGAGLSEVSIPKYCLARSGWSRIPCSTTLRLTLPSELIAPGRYPLTIIAGYFPTMSLTFPNSASLIFQGTAGDGVARRAMTARFGAGIQEAGHAIVMWALGLTVGTIEIGIDGDDARGSARRVSPSTEEGWLSKRCLPG
jgi:hypothetical protein